ncbi:MAG TPA: SIMPL domain-containing protein [Thermoanaerobaculia bacterium]|nr:SIMPL domain-containing protein [Thermoanaerobaculia bacterium]
MRKTALVVLALFALPLLAAEDNRNTITVTGSGNVKVAPDRVSFTVGVMTTKPTVREAFAENNAKTQRVVDALKARGVKAPEIQTSNFSVSQETNDMGRPTGRYVVSNMVTVTREDPKGVSDLLQAAIDAGANEAGNLRFFISNPSEAQNRALEKAYRDARASAERLAAVAGKALGDAMTITTAPAYFGYAQNNVAENITVTAAPAIETGVVDTNASVTVTFELK